MGTLVCHCRRACGWISRTGVLAAAVMPAGDVGLVGTALSMHDVREELGIAFEVLALSSVPVVLASK